MRRLRSIVLSIVLLLLIGATINIFVAWAITWAADGSAQYHNAFGAEVEGDRDWELTRFDATGATWYRSEHTQTPESSEVRQYLWEALRKSPSPRPLLADWPYIDAMPAEFMRLCAANPDEAVRVSQLQYAAGWPMRALWCDIETEIYGPQEMSIQRRMGAINISGLDGDNIIEPFVPEMLPLRPIWPGFAINTALFALAIWIPFFAPRELRSIWRWRRGLCLKCGYPIGTSDVCTECGTAIRRRPTASALTSS